MLPIVSARTHMLCTRSSLFVYDSACVGYFFGVVPPVCVCVFVFVVGLIEGYYKDTPHSV